MHCNAICDWGSETFKNLLCLVFVDVHRVSAASNGSVVGPRLGCFGRCLEMLELRIAR